MHRLILALVLLTVPSLAFAQGPPGPPSIVTRGEGTIKRAPDQAFVSIAAESRASTPAEAQRLAAEAMTSVQAALKKAGIAADAIKTTGYSLQPDMEWVDGRSRVRGYIARNQVEVRVDALDEARRASSMRPDRPAPRRWRVCDSISRTASASSAKRCGLAVQDAMARARAIAVGRQAHARADPAHRRAGQRACRADADCATTMRARSRGAADARLPR